MATCSDTPISDLTVRAIALVTAYLGCLILLFLEAFLGNKYNDRLVTRVT